MPREDKSVVARLTIKGEHFEVLVDPDQAQSVRSGKQVNPKDLLISEVIYKDGRKGLKASGESGRKNFGPAEPMPVAEAIIRRGELQLTTDQRRELVENKRKQIIAFIARNCVDPKSGIPHPPLRIENAMEGIRYNIDPFKSVEEQAQEVIKLLRIALPLKVSQVRVSIKVSKESAGRVSAAATKMGTVTKSLWLADGSWQGEAVIPAGIQQSFIDKLNELSRGNVEVNITKI